jgi:hypothetical protein
MGRQAAQRRAQGLGSRRRLALALGICALFGAPAFAKKKPAVDPFGPPPVKWTDADHAWRPVALDTLFRWYNRFVGPFPKSILLYPHVGNLEEDRFYTAAELKELMTPEDWNALVAVHLDKVRGLATRVVFVNVPAENPNSHDLLGPAAALSAAMQVPFDLGSGVQSLANYRWFNQQRETLYKSFDINCQENRVDAVCTLKQFIDRQVGLIAGSLPEPERSRIKDRRATFDTQLSEAAVVWASASLQTPEIKLSPMLVRTLFMQGVNSCAPIQWKYRFPVEGPQTAATGRWDLAFGEPSLIAGCFVQFGEGLTYPLAHELAHVFLSENPKTALFGSEKCADVFAVNYMASSGGGLLEWVQLLKIFDSEDGITYFGFGQGQEDSKRLQQLRELRVLMQSTDLHSREQKVSPLDAARQCVQEETAAAVH